MIHVYVKYLMIGIKPSSTNAAGCFLQTIMNPVSVFPEALCRISEAVTFFYLVSHLIS